MQIVKLNWFIIFVVLFCFASFIDSTFEHCVIEKVTFNDQKKDIFVTEKVVLWNNISMGVLLVCFTNFFFFFNLFMSNTCGLRLDVHMYV